MGQRRRLIAGAVAVVLAAAAFGSLPMRYVVEGVSMAPGIMPGDIVRTNCLPGLDRWRTPRRFQRWLLDAPGAGVGIKRIAGLPGETVTVRDGDLAVDDEVVLKGPDVLAQMATEVARHTVEPPGDVHVPSREVLDDADVAAEVSRPLLPVRDVGLVAIVDRGAGGVVRALIDVGSRRITWRLDRPGRTCLVAGRLDGRLVATAWHLPAVADSARSAIPLSAPLGWSHAEPWPDPDAEVTTSPRLAFAIRGIDGAAPANATVERLATWRDVVLRPAIDGTTLWRLGADDVFVLGDFPSGSRDCRQWGPLPASALRHQIGF